eukprot:TRINITY_DN2400_c0_g1_i2.p1 TRINITY_DN2400_c0_g1~~TRINITY_DN2400_c0_g1_i2.p1  ORF type:complete len:549 (-),score=32.91 TRINITY_DN2400_c0_g1_i2:201-1691(-)
MAFSANEGFLRVVLICLVLVSALSTSIADKFNEETHPAAFSSTALRWLSSQFSSSASISAKVDSLSSPQGVGKNRDGNSSNEASVMLANASVSYPENDLLPTAAIRHDPSPLPERTTCPYFLSLLNPLSQDACSSVENIHSQHSQSANENSTLLRTHRVLSQSLSLPSPPDLISRLGTYLQQALAIPSPPPSFAKRLKSAMTLLWDILSSYYKSDVNRCHVKLLLIQKGIAQCTSIITSPKYKKSLKRSTDQVQLSIGNLQSASGVVNVLLDVINHQIIVTQVLTNTGRRDWNSHRVPPTLYAQYCQDKVFTEMDAENQLQASITFDDSGCGGRLSTLQRYPDGFFSARIQCPQGNSSGLVSSFYMSSREGDKNQDEIDFEFLGNNPFGVQTNFYVNGTGLHEQIHDLGFDCSLSMHTYSVIWNSQQISWYVDQRWLRTVYNFPDQPYPVKPMFVYASVWNASWVLDGGWTGVYYGNSAPYTVYYQNITIISPLPQ